MTVASNTVLFICWINLLLPVAVLGNYGGYTGDQRFCSYEIEVPIKSSCGWFEKCVTGYQKQIVEDCCPGLKGKYCDTVTKCDEIMVIDAHKKDIYVTSLHDGYTYELGIDTYDGYETELHVPVDLCVDYEKQWLFFVDAGTQWIYKLDLAAAGGGGAFGGSYTYEPFIQLPHGSESSGLVCDTHNHKLFVTSGGDKPFIGVVHYYEPRPKLIPLRHLYNNLALSLHKPRDIEVDSKNKIIFWSDWGNKPYLAKANYDGSDAKIILHSETDKPLKWLNGIAYDPLDEVLYFVDGYYGIIGFTSLYDGYSGIIHTAPYFSQYFDIVYVDEYLYVTDWFSNSVLKIHKSGGTLFEMQEENFSRAMGITAVCYDYRLESHYGCCDVGYYGKHCDIQCPEGQVWNEHGQECPHTCAYDYPGCTGTQPRCECPPGEVHYSEEDRRCIPQVACPPNINIGETTYTCADGSNPCTVDNIGSKFNFLDDKNKFILCEENAVCTVKGKYSNDSNDLFQGNVDPSNVASNNVG